jgi:hypothetical protein
VLRERWSWQRADFRLSLRISAAARSSLALVLIAEGISVGGEHREKYRPVSDGQLRQGKINDVCDGSCAAKTRRFLTFLDAFLHDAQGKKPQAIRAGQRAEWHSLGILSVSRHPDQSRQPVVVRHPRCFAKIPWSTRTVNGYGWTSSWLFEKLAKLAKGSTQRCR